MKICVLKFQEYFDAKDYQKARDELSKISSKDLALIVLHADAAKSPLNDYLKSPQLENFWAGKYHALKVNRLPEFKFSDLSSRSCIDLYCGYILYLNAQKSKGSKKLYYFLNLAIKGFNSFHALQTYSSTLIENIDKNLQTFHLKDSNLEQNIVQPLLHFYFTFLNQLVSHKTPGFLCLANITIYLARFYHCAYNPVLSSFFFEKTWYHLHMAGLLEKKSVAEMNNAYFGKGIAFSNHLYLSSITELKKVCLETAWETSEDLLSIVQQTRLEKAALDFVLGNFPELFHEEDNPSLPPPPLSPKLKRNPSVVLQSFLLLSPLYKSPSTAQFTFESLDEMKAGPLT